MSEYEFSQEQNKVMNSLANRMRYVGILVAFVGLARIITNFQLASANGYGLGFFLFILGMLMNVAIGVTFYLPADNLKRIATTEGKDIPELMAAMRELSVGFNILRAMAVIVILLAIAGNFLGIG